MGAAFSWMEVTADESDGDVQVLGAGDTSSDATDLDSVTPETVTQCALMGFGAIAEDGDMVLVREHEDRPVAVAALTARPTGSQAGDRFITHKDGGLFRLRHTVLGTEIEFTGAATLNGILLGSDGAMLYVARSTDPVVLSGVSVGTIQATSLHVKAA